MTFAALLVIAALLFWTNVNLARLVELRGDELIRAPWEGDA